MIRCHIVKDLTKIRFLFDSLLNVNFVVCSVGYSLRETPLFSWNQGLEIHEIFSQGPSLIKTAKVYNSSSDNLTLVNTKDLLLLELFQGINGSSCHTDW